MATHCRIPAWRIPWTEDLVGYRPWGHEESDTAEATACIHNCAFGLLGTTE